MELLAIVGAVWIVVGGPARYLVTEAIPLENVQTVNRQRRFVIDPGAYRAAEALADARGLVLAGFYHSHPNHPAEPSAFDLEHAWPNFSYPIVAVHDGQAAEMRSWRLRADRTAFDEEPIDLED